jgi:hypothetical protein
MKSRYEKAKEAFEQAFPAFVPHVNGALDAAPSKRKSNPQRPYKYQFTNDAFEMCNLIFMLGLHAGRVEVITESEQPDNSPALVGGKVAVCKICGCDDYHACTDELGHACHWVTVDRAAGTGICSMCAQGVKS